MATIQAIEARSVHQIQSGQVIVDLCSVAKELVENSLDAGATSIEVRFKNNGLDLIEVQDNGAGISPDNYGNVALKHYTSKLSSFDDLSRLQTFGFRGEALSSLCALADFHIVTAQANQVPRANRLDFESSGKLLKTQIVAGQKGTTASVEGIFKRLPVRRRELEKNIKREYGKVLNLLHAYACISTNVRFSVRNTVGKTRNVVVFTTNGNRTTKENIANVYGAKTLSALIPLELELDREPSAPTRRATGANEPQNKILVRGHISRPVFGEGRQTPDRQMFFVNSRPCALPQIAKTFNEVYKSFNVSQSPFIFADFQMDTNAYDVNVSPDKRTVLLHDAGALIESLKTSLVQLFEAADQTIPQAQVLGSKATPAKQQALASLPGFVSARQISPSGSEDREVSGRDQDEDEAEGGTDPSQQSAQNEIKRFMSSYDESDRQKAAPVSAAAASTPQRASMRPPAATPAEREQVSPATLMDDSGRSQVSKEVVDESVPEASQQGPPQSSGVEDGTASQPEDYEEMPNVIQTAFDRMRPLRRPAEMATISIGDRTVTSMVGSGLSRKRTSGAAGDSAGGQPQRKRRIHKPSQPTIFGKQMRAFAAPGSQACEDQEQQQQQQEEEEEEEEEEASERSSSETGENDIEEEEEANGRSSSEVGENDIEEEEEAEGDSSLRSEDIDYVPADNSQDHDLAGPTEMDKSRQADEADSNTATDKSSLDEAEKKVQDEAVVQRLIHAAEETAALPQEHNVSRANKMNKGAAHRDTTVHLVSTIDGSVSRLQSQMAKLRACLQPHVAVSEKENPDLSGEDKTAEDRLSLTVSKADFAQMRIIGQFNLGFILAVRPAADHDELFIIDQHASDEKFNFERLQAETVVQNQRLVRPQRLDLTAVEEEIVLENRAALEKNGFLVTVDESGDEPIGRRCQLVSLPLSKEVVFGSRDLEELIALLSESPAASSAHSVPRPSKVRKMFAMRACRSSIMIGKTLTTRQMERVVRNMGTIDKPWNCPHGRPTMRHLMSLAQWEEWDDYEEEETDDSLDVWRQYLEEENEAEDGEAEEG